MLTGIHPFELGMYTEKSRIPDEAPLAAEFLKSAGYQTAAFVDSAPKGLLGGERGFARGFDRFDHAPFRPDLQYKYDIAVTVEEAQKWLTRIDKNRPFFLFLHTKSVHDTPNVKDGDPRGFPYDKPQPYRLRYLADEQAQFNWRPPFGIYLRYHNVLLANGKLKPKDYPPQRLEALKGQYDAGIYYTDEYFAKLLVILEQMGLSVNTIVILTADHGEAFLEHRFFHHIEVYNQLLHVPLIVRLPYQHGRRTIETPVALEDIVPTILNLADIDVPKVLTSKPLPTEPVPVRAERPFYGYYQFGSNVFLDEFSLLKGDWKLVYLKYSEGKWQAELYNITNDRGEFNPVVGRDDIETNMRKSLLKWMTTQPKFGSADITLDPKTIEHLRSLGYVD
jgi:arylsulfatase A-like enzyme